MKHTIKFLLGILTIFVICSCTPEKGSNKEYKQSNGIVYSIKEDVSLTERFYIIVISYNGDTHEFISDSRGLTHWPNCRYCKHKDHIDTCETID